MQYVKPERVWLKTHPEFNEVWVHDRIKADPSILGLGSVVVKDRERPQPRAGRLDLLLQDPDTDRRYEVEIQLGSTDERHIIRTIEYWDIEKKRYPQYDHCAVIVAEDITTRFLNVIGLFNSSIPLIAIQMNAFVLAGNISLLFTTVMNELERGLVDEDEELQEPADRNYWEARSAKEMMAATDEMLGWIQEFDPSLQLKYNKFYIGLARNGIADNFTSFQPRKHLFG